MPIQRLCLHCHALFTPTTSQINRGVGFYCSQKCRYDSKCTPEAIAARFWAYVDKTTDPDGHWLWTGPRFTNGYGQFWPGRGHVGQMAHRFAYVLMHGPIPDGLLALHEPPCVNPLCVRQIYLGTQKQNYDDMATLGRRRNDKGAANPQARLTEALVLAIREEYAQGTTNQHVLARKYGVNHNTIHNIVRRKLWTHI
jgi:hypothetical protein